MTIAVDVMGGDYALRVPIQAAVEAKINNISILLVGEEKKIIKELKEQEVDPSEFEIVNAEENISMDDTIDKNIIKKKSSIRICYQLMKQNKATAVVSAGHSGAMVALGTLIIRTIDWVDRPCLGAFLPSKKGKILITDAGANIECSAKDLMQFAVLSNSYLKTLYNISKPKIGLLNIGSEKSKGNNLYKESFKLFEKSNLNFIGNVEGSSFFLEDIDVIICDGFSGNILLKTAQGAENFLNYLIKKAFYSTFINKIKGIIVQSIFQKIKSSLYFQYYGGAPLLGLNGISIVCHGSSNKNAIYSAITLADWASKNDYINKLKQSVSIYKSAF